MIRIRYAAASGLDVEGSAEELRHLYSQVRPLARQDSGRITINADATGDPAPYEAFLQRAVISVEPGSTMVKVVDGRDLRIAASPANLERLASFINLPVDASADWHSHCEYYPGNKWISPKSEPLVFSLRRVASA